MFTGRLLLRATVFMSGPAAAVFYDCARFTRAGAAPEPLRVSRATWPKAGSSRWYGASARGATRRRREAPHASKETAFAYIPQGGGNHYLNHCCPGESITLALMKLGLDFLLQRLEYAVPAQDLRIDAARLPALPRSRFVIGDVRVRQGNSR